MSQIHSATRDGDNRFTYDYDYQSSLRNDTEFSKAKEVGIT